MKIGIIREGKIPPDYRAPMSPEQVGRANDLFDIELVVQSSPDRCFKDSDYIAENVEIVEDVSDCDVLLGVKEVPIDHLIPEKTYFFFSHTIKKQPHNAGLLAAVLKKNIRLIDYELLTDNNGNRLIAFGKFAGIVGAHNALLTYGSRTGLFSLKRMKDCEDYNEAKEIYKGLDLPNVKIVLTGMGRVGAGAAMVLKDMGIKQVEPDEYLSGKFDEPVFTQIDSDKYVERVDGMPYKQEDFYANPQSYKSKFGPYTKASDIMINGIYWDFRAPAFFNKEEMKSEEFRIQVVADITCDIAPSSSIPSTLRASTIEEPVFGYHPDLETEVDAFRPDAIDMMTIDNLPNELPRDASRAFGAQFIDKILPELLMPERSPMLARATIARNGELTEEYKYLKGYAELGSGVIG
jgi:alanine dehydrogenase